MRGDISRTAVIRIKSSPPLLRRAREIGAAFGRANEYEVENSSPRNA